VAVKTTVKQIADESFILAIIRILGKPYLRITALRCVASIFRHFFFLQYRAALLPGRIPVSKVDHPLDGKIPFLPGKVNTYLDFVAFWVRPLGFLLKSCGRGILKQIRDFLETMGDLYAWAAEVYGKNLSTTERPFYIGRPRFLLIHALDPHLMCIPSLHVMVVIRTYTLFSEIVKSIGEGFAPQAEELRRGALAITEAVLYIKQHSVNCISAAMYAMTRFDHDLFPPAEAERFASGLFTHTKTTGKEDVGEIRGEISDEVRKHILSLYRSFVSEGESCDDWTGPLLNFMTLNGKT